MSDLSISFEGSQFSADQESSTYQRTLIGIYREEVASFYWGHVFFQLSWYENLLLQLAVEVGEFRSWPPKFTWLIDEFANEFLNSNQTREYSEIKNERLIENNSLAANVALAEATWGKLSSEELNMFSQIIYAFVFLYGVSDGNIDHRFSVFLTQLCRQLKLWNELSELELDAKHALHFQRVRKIFYEDLHMSVKATPSQRSEWVFR